MQTFKKSRALTMGVEEEYTLCDPATGALVHGIEKVFMKIPDNHKPRVSRELMQCCLEMNTPICETAGAVLNNVSALRKTLSESSGQCGMKLLALGTHPLAELKNLPTTDTEHYRWVRDQCAYSATRMISCGLHVHIGVETPEEQLYLFRSLRRWMPVITALAANSPFLEGAITGFSSSRYLLFGSMPRTGYPPPIMDYDELDKYIETMKQAGSINGPGDLWWLVRPQPPLGTVEVRAMDQQLSAQDAAAFAGLVQSLSAAILEDRAKTPEKEPAFHILIDNHWKAARFGLSASVIDPYSGEVRSMVQDAELLIKLAGRHAESLGARDSLSHIQKIISEGNSSSKLLKRAVEEESGDLASLTVKLLSEFLS